MGLVEAAGNFTSFCYTYYVCFRCGIQPERPSCVVMEEPALPLGVSCYSKYSSTDTLLTSLTSESGSPYRRTMTPGEDRQYTLSQRLRRRKDVLQQRKCIVDICFVLGLTGEKQIHGRRRDAHNNRLVPLLVVILIFIPVFLR